MEDKQNQRAKAERIAELSRLQQVVADAHEAKRKRYIEDLRRSVSALKYRMAHTDMLPPGRW